jgi:hypothetical protein
MTMLLDQLKLAARGSLDSSESIQYARPRSTHTNDGSWSMGITALAFPQLGQGS